MRAGIESLLRSKTQLSRIPLLSAKVRQRTGVSTCGDPPGGENRIVGGN